jgi:hypothetical protein
MLHTPARPASRTNAIDEVPQREALRRGIAPLRTIAETNEMSFMSAF